MAKVGPEASSRIEAGEHGAGSIRERLEEIGVRVYRALNRLFSIDDEVESTRDAARNVAWPNLDIDRSGQFLKPRQESIPEGMKFDRRFGIVDEKFDTRG